MVANNRSLLRLHNSVEKQYHKKPKEDRVCVKALLELGADVNMKDHCGRTALFIAAFHGWVESLRLLLKAKADIKTCDVNQVNLPWYESKNLYIRASPVYTNSLYEYTVNMKSECRKNVFAAGREVDTSYMEEFFGSLTEDRHGLQYMTREIIRKYISSNLSEH